MAAAPRPRPPFPSSPSRGHVPGESCPPPPRPPPPRPPPPWLLGFSHPSWSPVAEQLAEEPLPRVVEAARPPSPPRRDDRSTVARSVVFKGRARPPPSTSLLAVPRPLPPTPPPTPPPPPPGLLERDWLKKRACCLERPALEAFFDTIRRREPPIQFIGERQRSPRKRSSEGERRRGKSRFYESKTNLIITISQSSGSWQAFAPTPAATPCSTTPNYQD